MFSFCSWRPYSGGTRTDKELQETLGYLNQCYSLILLGDGCVCELKAKQPNGSQHPCCTGRIGQVCSSSSNVELPLVYSPCCFHSTRPQILQSVLCNKQQHTDIGLHQLLLVYCNSSFVVFLQLLVCLLSIDIASVWRNGPHRFFQIVHMFFRVAIIIHL
jgi:hypothetical protein